MLMIQGSFGRQTLWKIRVIFSLYLETLCQLNHQKLPKFKKINHHLDQLHVDFFVCFHTLFGGCLLNISRHFSQVFLSLSLFFLPIQKLIMFSSVCRERLLPVASFSTLFTHCFTIYKIPRVFDILSLDLFWVKRVFLFRQIFWTQIFISINRVTWWANKGNLWLLKWSLRGNCLQFAEKHGNSKKGNSAWYYQFLALPHARQTCYKCFN